MQRRPLRADETPSTVARDGYNRSARRYLEWTTSLPSPRVEWLNKLFVRVESAGQLNDTHILELGCGAGTPCTVLTAQKVTKITAVDISSTQLSIARTTLDDAKVGMDKVQLIDSDMLDLKFENGTFAAIYALYSLIHLSPADQSIMLERCHAWLKPGGYILFNVTADASSGDGNAVVDWLGMDAFWAGMGTEATLEEVKRIGFVILDDETIQSDGDAAFTWIIAAKPAEGIQNTATVKANSMPSQQI